MRIHYLSPCCAASYDPGPEGGTGTGRIVWRDFDSDPLAARLWHPYDGEELRPTAKEAMQVCPQIADSARRTLSLAVNNPRLRQDTIDWQAAVALAGEAAVTWVRVHLWNTTMEERVRLITTRPLEERTEYLMDPSAEIRVAALQCMAR